MAADTYPWFEDFKETCRDVAEDVLEPAKKICSDYPVTADFKAVVGKPADVLPQLARSENAELIVLGTRGLGVVRGVIGSVTPTAAPSCSLSCAGDTGARVGERVGALRRKERMRKLMELVRNGRLDLSPLITHRFSLDDIECAYELFGNQKDGVVKVALTPNP